MDKRYEPHIREIERTERIGRTLLSLNADGHPREVATTAGATASCRIFTLMLHR
jgi:hypothetical protein